MRLFVALDLPNPIKDKLFTLRDEELSGARWTTSQQWHVTLHFIGERDDDTPIQQSLANVRAAPFDMLLEGVGTFPEKGKPRVLWLGIEAPDNLQTLHQAVGETLRGTGYKPENRPYQPHLTLARFKQQIPNRDEMQAYLTQQDHFQTASFPITHFTLYQSELQRGGAVYTVRQRYPLAVNDS